MKTGFPPVADAETRLFILGSLPGDRSLALGQYYGHPTNQFWRLLGAVVGEDLASLPYEARLERLRANGVGLWDVFHAAHRPGSGDSAIRDGRHNPLAELSERYPRLAAIAFNGGIAAREGRRAFPKDGPVALFDLPSSSAANTCRFEVKLASWKRLTSFLAAR
ncbi:MAG TPA: DNA-deoxyinosine glycosylase [Sphingomicrobium sp.]|nr:DNA-deoxyinosine glycosylase [Sphingomicrobium sp.]